MNANTFKINRIVLDIKKVKGIHFEEDKIIIEVDNLDSDNRSDDGGTDKGRDNTTTTQ